jgi:hypothetical protein
MIYFLKLLTAKNNAKMETLESLDLKSKKLAANKIVLMKKYTMSKKELNKLLEIVATISWTNEPVKFFFDLDIISSLLAKGYLDSSKDGYLTTNELSLQIWEEFQNIMKRFK